MPVFNSASTVAASIASVRLQAVSDWELVVVDDGSSDDSAAVVSRASDDRTRILRQANGGVSAALNAGIRAARGRYIALLGSDDLFLPTYLEAMARALAGDPEAALAYTDGWVLDDKSGRMRRTSILAQRQQLPLTPAHFDEMLKENFIPALGTVIRASVFEEIGYFNEQLRGSEDWEFWLRLLAAGHHGVRADGVNTVYRVQAESLSHRPGMMTIQRQRMYSIIAEDWGAPEDVCRRARALAEQQSEIAGARQPATGWRRATDPREWADVLKSRVRRHTRWSTDFPDEVETLFADIERLLGTTTRSGRGPEELEDVRAQRRTE